ncbi:MAG: carboxypeptidase regulatory-like domain-containing protein [Acidobacteriota bacterium]|nr:carboxypeptidase regulatory-like domain-containing protein [Blastocatellia bacterium]MDW8239877.1 carboxypeptidase regulatory-like domain-containing protein [Acidobacteriota bacterium]
MKKINLIMTGIFALGLLAVFSLPASAQTGGIEGQVLRRNADGTKTPVAKAVVDLYRLGIKGSYKAETDKNGRFAHIGLPYGRYAIAVSGEGLAPYYEYNVQIPPGQPIERTFELFPGDGRRLSLADIERIQAQAGTQQPLTPAQQAEQQKQMEEAQKKYEESRKKAAADQVMIKHFEAGKQLASTNQYEPAIAEYKLALEASPDHPQLYVVVGKMAEAYFNLGVERNNSGNRQLAVESFALAAETAKKGADMVPADKAVEKPKLLQLHAQSLGVIARLDNKRVPEAVAAYEQLIQMYTTPEEKLKAQNAIGDIYLNATMPNEAAENYRKTLAADPNNLDALRGLGMALVQTGDESKYQEVVDVLSKFTDKAAKEAASNPKRAQEVEEANQVIFALKEAMKTQPKKKK